MCIPLADLPTALADGQTEIRPLQLRDKIGFLLYSRELLYHFEPVMQLLPADRVEAIVYSPYDGEAIRSRLAELPYAWHEGPELVSRRIGYRVLVSNHAGGLETLALRFADGSAREGRNFPFRLLGGFNARFMYCLGADYWNLQGWNALYDAFLCYGPHQTRQLASFPGIKLQMGYPRYDAFFNQPLDARQKAALLARWGGDPAKPTVLWLTPLMNYQPALHDFAGSLSGLSASHNLLIKPHPHSPPQEQAYYAGLDNYPFTAVIRGSIDNLLLFQLADYVVCEYGGTSYGALYTDKNLLLFDHPSYAGHAEADPLKSDTDAWLRLHLPHLLPEQAHQLPALIADSDLWEAQKQIRARLRELFFTPAYGHSAQLAAGLLWRMLQLVPA